MRGERKAGVCPHWPPFKNAPTSGRLSGLKQRKTNISLKMQLRTLTDSGDAYLWETPWNHEEWQRFVIGVYALRIFWTSKKCYMSLLFCSIIHVTGVVYCMKKKKTKYKKAIKAVSGFPTHFQRSKITKSATKRCVCALRVRVCAHAGLSRIVCAFCSRHSKALKAERRAFKAVIDFCLLGWPPSCPCARGCLATGLWFAFTWQGGQRSAQSVPPHGRRLLYRKTPLQLIPAKLFPIILSN